MEIALITKLVFFIFWPFLLLLIMYLWDRKKFMKKWEKYKKQGFFQK
jgi:TM2 domain-containing membrane protein YozV